MQGMHFSELAPLVSVSHIEQASINTILRTMAARSMGRLIRTVVHLDTLRTRARA